MDLPKIENQNEKEVKVAKINISFLPSSTCSLGRILKLMSPPLLFPHLLGGHLLFLVLFCSFGIFLVLLVYL